MLKSKLTALMLALALVCFGFAFAGCKKKDEAGGGGFDKKKAAACAKEATKDSDTCKACCKKARGAYNYSGKVGGTAPAFNCTAE